MRFARLLLGSACASVAPLSAPNEDPLAARIDAGIARAEAGDLPAALDEFTAARTAADAAGSSEVWRCATFDEARARFERARSRPLPGAPPAETVVPITVVVDARAQIAAVRDDLEAARHRLLELFEREDDDAGAQAALAQVAARLRDVEARDAQWRALVTLRNEAAAGNAAERSSPMKQGPSAKSSVGTKGERAGAASEGEGEQHAAPGDGEGEAALSGTARLTGDEERALLDRLADSRAARRELDRRRADQAAARSGGRQ